MDVTMIQGAMASAKAALSLVRGAVDATVDAKLKDRLIEVQQAILDVQMMLGDAQADRLDLLQQVSDLKDTVRALQSASAALEAYELVEIEPGKLLWRSKDDGKTPSHYACPTCRSQGRISVLQTLQGHTRSHYQCAACKFLLYFGPKRAAEQRDGSGGWMSA